MKITEQNKDILWKSHGVKFKGAIDGVFCEGVIGVDIENNRVVLCQNVVDGVITSVEVLQGYDFAWSITKRDTTDILMDCEEIELIIDEPKMGKPLGSFDIESLEMDIKTVRTRNPIQDAIDYLKSNGYKVLKAEWHEV